MKRLTLKEEADPKTPSFDSRTLVSHRGHVTETVTLVELVYTAPFSIDMPTASPSSC